MVDEHRLDRRSAQASTTVSVLIVKPGWIDDTGCYSRAVSPMKVLRWRPVIALNLWRSKCVIITLITHLDEARHDTPDTAPNAGTFSGRSHG